MHIFKLLSQEPGLERVESVFISNYHFELNQWINMTII